MKWLKKNWIDLLLLGIVLTGSVLIIYPSFSDYWNKLHQSAAISDYAEAVTQIDDGTYERMLQDAAAYNKELAKSTLNFSLTEEEKENYNNELSITSKGVMGYIEITKINCYLPIYHGVDDSVLQVAVGHIPGSSLPIGGETSHCILSGHRGLPSAKLFSDLDKMEIGDKFVIRVLDETLTYEVDNIMIVEPQDTASLTMVEGEDYVTLVTCTPYGINSHRLLVRGRRVENEEQSFTIRVTADAMLIDKVIVAPFVAAPILLILIVMVMAGVGKRKR